MGKKSKGKKQGLSLGNISPSPKPNPKALRAAEELDGNPGSPNSKQANDALVEAENRKYGIGSPSPKSKDWTPEKINQKSEELRRH